MAGHDLIVIGASSGGVEALTTLMSGLPPGLPASLFIVLHVPPEAPSFLPAILNRVAQLPVAHAVDSEPIRLGRVYVAPPGLQTYVHRGRLRVLRGPAENLHRPAIDPLFRTAAHHYGSRVIGVILSGALDDGTAGLRTVKQGGGIAVVQDPDDAAFRSMPSNAMAAVPVDFCLPVHEIPAVLTELVSTGAAPGDMTAEIPLETVEEAAPFDASEPSAALGRTSALTCPDCNGTLWEIQDGPSVRFRCRVGHAFTDQTMIHAQETSIERALWTALRSLEERIALLQRLADHARDRGHARVAALYGARAAAVGEEARMLHELITTGRALNRVLTDDSAQ